jgi:hypothetical protein
MHAQAVNIQEVSGKNTVSREDGKVVYEKIKELWDHSDKINIDFGNLLIASVSFIDEAFGHLALEHSQDELRNKLAFVNINEYDRALLNDILRSRFRQQVLSASPRRAHLRPKKRRIRSNKR